MTSALCRSVVIALGFALQGSYGSAQEQEEWFGIDITSQINSSYRVQVRANPGDHLPSLVDMFYNQHGEHFTRNKGDANALLTALEESGGGKCDACLTFVELLTKFLQQMGLKHATRAGQDQFGRSERKMHIDNDMEKTIGALCKDSSYLDFSEPIRKGCTDILGHNQAGEALRRFQGETLKPKDVVKRKQQICVEQFQVCEPKTQYKASNCRTCTEVMSDLHFVLRRSSRNNTVPLLPGSKRTRKHILTELQELCYDTEYRHPPQQVEQIREMCEQIVEESQEEIVRAFVAEKATGQCHPNPVEALCVDHLHLCAPQEFKQTHPRAQHYQHYIKQPKPPSPMPPSPDTKEEPDL